MSLVLEFLEFVEKKAPPSVSALLARILLKCRETTGAEAGTVHVVRRRGRQTLLEMVQRQNDAVPVAPAADDRASPVNTATIVGFVAATGEPVRESDVRRIRSNKPYAFNRNLDPPGYVTRSVLCLPVKNFQGDVVAVVELINRRLKGREVPAAFTRDQANLLLPVMRVLSGYIERTDNLERIAAQNVKLRQRARSPSSAPKLPTFRNRPKTPSNFRSACWREPQKFTTKAPATTSSGSTSTAIT